MNKNNKNSTLLMLWILIGSIIMFFGGLTSAYLVRKGGDDWISLTLPNDFTISTLVILMSSLTLFYASHFIKKDQHDLSSLLIGVTFIFGILFFILQFKGFNSLVKQGVYLTGEKSTISGSFLYVLVIAHLLHIIAGLLTLIYLFVKTIGRKFSSRNFVGFKASCTFWHFLDLLWLYLFLFLLFIP